MQAFYRGWKMGRRIQIWYENGQLQNADILSGWKIGRRMQMLV